jgi:hypothetical protein
MSFCCLSFYLMSKRRITHRRMPLSRITFSE